MDDLGEMFACCILILSTIWLQYVRVCFLDTDVSLSFWVPIASTFTVNSQLNKYLLNKSTKMSTLPNSGITVAIACSKRALYFSCSIYLYCERDMV